MKNPIKVTIPIDQGNRLIKTKNFDFPASCVDGTTIASVGSDVLKYNDKEIAFTRSLQRQLNDKTEDDRYFNLTLGAIAKELDYNERLTGVKYSLEEIIEIKLLIGLPLAHCKKLGGKYVEYFKTSRPLTFMFNGKFYNIHITEVTFYPQGVAAVFAARKDFEGTRDVFVADVGGFTLDSFRMAKAEGQTRHMPDADTCRSSYWGVNHLFEKINEAVHADGGMHDIPVGIMEGFLRKEIAALNETSSERAAYITETAQEYANQMLSNMANNGCDLKEDYVVFIGGGAILLEDYILRTGRLKKEPYFITDIKANVKGYEILNKLEEVARANKAVASSGNVVSLSTPVSTKVVASG